MARASPWPITATAAPPGKAPVAAARWQLEMNAALDSAQQAAPGRSCPLSYRYSPTDFAREVQIKAQTLYVVGGLYGNIDALDAIEAMYAQERGVAGADKQMVFNGDFHWFDADPALFAAINQRVRAHIALRGNVETEVVQDDSGAGCGCAYPDDVDDGTVARSNQIIARLQQIARTDANARTWLTALPMTAVAQVGTARIGVVHGDAESLAGWNFDAVSLDDPARANWLRAVFDAARVNIFASSHTCAAALRAFESGRAVINNGAAGMSSLPGTSHGIVTRIGLTPAASHLPVLASATIAGVHLQALAVQFDAAAWNARFLAMWPEGSAAHQSYWARITGGPKQSVLHAAGHHCSGAK
ncbi:MAG: hypothetical protein ACRCV9_08115 [Burkholderiaceae bacterium]